MYSHDLPNIDDLNNVQYFYENWCCFCYELILDELIIYLSSIMDIFYILQARWLSTAGGTTAPQASKNVVNLLFKHSMQLLINKTGKGNKLPIKALFPPMISE